MHSAPHRNNSDFQLRHFVGGSCHTPDAAWNVLYEQRLDILQKREATRAKLLRREANRLDLEQQKAAIASEQDRLRYEANKIEFDAGEGMLEMALAGADKEIATIEGLMAELEPQRKYKHLPLLEATEAAQPEEWALEFKHRAENYLLSIGTIPADQLEAMRKHPDFDAVILPHIKHKMALLENARTRADAANLLTGTSGLLLTQRDDDSTAT
jgi:exonuclease VII large subunit